MPPDTHREIFLVATEDIPWPLVEETLEKCDTAIHLVRSGSTKDFLDQVRHSGDPAPDVLLLSNRDATLSEKTDFKAALSRLAGTSVVVFSDTPDASLLSLSNRNRNLFLISPQNPEDLLHILGSVAEKIFSRHPAPHSDFRSEAPDGLPLELLVVEDNPGDQVLLREMVRGSAFGRPLSLIFARSLTEARQLLENVSVDAVLLDLALPDGEGIQSLRTFREFDDQHPVVILSGVREEAIAVSALAAGAQDFLVKEMVTAPLLLRSVAYAVKRKEMELALASMASSDPLTGLANRKGFIAELSRSLENGRRSGRPFALLILDLNRFKSVNDTYGHGAGDSLLLEVAGRMHRLVRRSDAIARLGGDEFAIILHNVGKPGSVSRFLEKLVARLALPFTVGNYRLSTEASIGTAMFPSDGETAEDLVAKADRAMYQAKQSGTRRYVFYDPEMDAEEDRRTAAIRETSLALEQGALTLCYQPVVNLLTDEIIYAEALVRWNHPEKGFLSPHSFLPLIAGSETISRLDRWVLDEAVSQLAKWTRKGITIPISVNLDASWLAQLNFHKDLASILTRHGTIPSGLLRVEIRENTETGSLSGIRKNLDRMKELGILISLDDFGVGQTTLPHLSSLPLDALKIDRNVILDFQSTRRNMGLIEGVAGLARGLGHKVVAKGLEKRSYGLLLEKMGCDLAQGFGISPPLPPEEFLSWHDGWSGSGHTTPEAREVSENELHILSVFVTHLTWLSRMITLARLEESPDDCPPNGVPDPSPVSSWFSGEGRKLYGTLPVFLPLETLSIEIESATLTMFDRLRLRDVAGVNTLACSLLARKDRLQSLYQTLQKESLLRTLEETPD